MLASFVLGYLILTLGIGLLAARRIRNKEDFILAGRSLPLYMEAASLFATWFGSETVLGSGEVMATEGLHGIAEDPLGASLCLILIGAWLAKRLYGMQVLTFGDFYRLLFGPRMEVVGSIFMILSYLAWIAAQFKALGFLFQLLWPELDLAWGVTIGSCIVIAYTFAGGMWSISVTDVIQAVLIVIGLVAVVWVLHHKLDMFDMLQRTPSELFLPYRGEGRFGWLNYLAAWMVIGLGSLPQQDVFQRIMSAKSAKVATRAAYIAAIAYLVVGALPIIIGLYSKQMLPQYSEGKMMIEMVDAFMPFAVKVLFTAALLSAIVSTASGALLAPATILSENLLKQWLPMKSESAHIRYSRISVLIIGFVSMSMAFRDMGIYELVAESSSMSLVSLFYPMVMGFRIHKRVKAQIAGGNYQFEPKHEIQSLASSLSGMTIWILALFSAPTESQSFIEPMLYGLAASILAWHLVDMFPYSTRKNLVSQ